MNLTFNDPLYSRWVGAPDKLLDLGAIKEGDRVLDLCGGTGVVSEAAINKGAAEVVLLDIAPKAQKLEHLFPLFRSVSGNAEEADAFLKHEYFDLVVCRQSVGYLNLSKTAEAVRNLLKPGGRFVFDSPKHPGWGLRTYRLNGNRYIEASGCIRDTLLFVRTSLGGDLGITKLRWHKDVSLPGYAASVTFDEPNVYFVGTKT